MVFLKSIDGAVILLDWLFQKSSYCDFLLRWKVGNWFSVFKLLESVLIRNFRANSNTKTHVRNEQNLNKLFRFWWLRNKCLRKRNGNENVQKSTDWTLFSYVVSFCINNTRTVVIHQQCLNLVLKTTLRDWLEELRRLKLQVEFVNNFSKVSLNSTKSQSVTLI